MTWEGTGKTFKMFAPCEVETEYYFRLYFHCLCHILCNDTNPYFLSLLLLDTNSSIPEGVLTKIKPENFQIKWLHRPCYSLMMAVQLISTLQHAESIPHPLKP